VLDTNYDVFFHKTLPNPRWLAEHLYANTNSFVVGAYGFVIAISL